MDVLFVSYFKDGVTFNEISEDRQSTKSSFATDSTRNQEEHNYKNWSVITSEGEFVSPSEQRSWQHRQLEGIPEEIPASGEETCAAEWRTNARKKLTYETQCPVSTICLKEDESANPISEFYRGEYPPDLIASYNTRFGSVVVVSCDDNHAEGIDSNEESSENMTPSERSKLISEFYAGEYPPYVLPYYHLYY